MSAGSVAGGSSSVEPLAPEACAHMPLAAWFGEQPCTVQLLGAGHINATYLVRLQDPAQPDEAWVLQSLSRSVFVDPATVMRNLERLMAWLQDSAGLPFAAPFVAVSYTHLTLPTILLV